MTRAILLVDHGSRRPDANAALACVARMVQHQAVQASVLDQTDEYVDPVEVPEVHYNRFVGLEQGGIPFHILHSLEHIDDRDGRKADEKARFSGDKSFREE